MGCIQIMTNNDPLVVVVERVVGVVVWVGDTPLQIYLPLLGLEGVRPLEDLHRDKG